MDLQNALDKLVAGAHGDPAVIARLCAEHRENRIERFRILLLRPDYPGVPVDDILTARLNERDYVDPRNNLCVFAWPSEEVKYLIARIQQRLSNIAPNIWLSPPEWLHMTVVELVHSKTPAELKIHAERAKPHAMKFTEFAAENPAALDRPMLSLDDTAVALTFLPVEDSQYTYLHLRRDLANICAESGVEVASKYYNTSSHITFARFANKSDLRDRQSVWAWVQMIDSINQWLKDEYWPKEVEGTFSPGLRWIVGAGHGVEIRKGRLWYGESQSVDFEEPEQI